MYQIDNLNAEMLRSFEMNVQPNLFSFTQLHTVWKVSCVQQTSGWDWTLNRNGLPREAEDHSPRTAQPRASQAQMRLGLASVTSRPPPVRKSKSNLDHSQKKSSSLSNSALKESHSKLTHGSPPTRLVPVALHTPSISFALGKVPGQAYSLGTCGNAPP
jgi:hypothetical protein